MLSSSSNSREYKRFKRDSGASADAAFFGINIPLYRPITTLDLNLLAFPTASRFELRHSDDVDCSNLRQEEDGHGRGACHPRSRTRSFERLSDLPCRAVSWTFCHEMWDQPGSERSVWRKAMLPKTGKRMAMPLGCAKSRETHEEEAAVTGRWRRIH